ncbi:AAA family ATPase [Candidatus Micrarchaeota archaeon]|nr:AAA family ATPase [Candidatus Micrarchaeota archaeon]
MPNPYDPQNPAKPDYFGGREQVLVKVQERFERARIQRQSGGILVQGHRGVGKTSLLNKITNIAAFDSQDTPSKLLVIYRRLSRTTSDNELYQLLNEEISVQVAARRSFLENLASQANRIHSLSAFELTVDIKAESQKQSAYQVWKSCLAGLRNADFVLLALDDADYLSPEAVGELKTIVEGPNPIPVVLVVSGGIDFEENLIKDYSPISRIFSGASFNLGHFTLEETKEVLEKPLSSEGTKWDASAVSALHRLTAGYPYLVQCLASATYLDNQTITAARVEGSVRSAVEIGRSWLDHEVSDASDQDVICFDKIARINKDILRSVEMSDEGISAPYIGRLVKLGVLKKISRGRYRIHKSPMIAVYLMLKRGLLA